MGRLSGYDAWKILTDQFEATAEDQLFRLSLDLFNFTWLESEDAPTQLAIIKNWWKDFKNGLATKGITSIEKLLELLFVSKILHVLPQSFEFFKSSCMLVNKKNEKSIDDLISSIVLFERNSDKAYSPNISGKALAIVKSSLLQSSQSRTNMPKKNSGKCHYCHKGGHWLKRICFKWIKDGRPLRNDSKDSSYFHSSKLAEASIATPNLALVLVSCLTPIFTVDDQKDVDRWIDNGATQHVSKCLIGSGEK